MRFLQTLYTSCRHGQSTGSGFQFYAFSEGLEPKELDEIEKLGLLPPVLDDVQPTESNSEINLPMALRYFRLSSGRVGLLKSTALSSDYSGRPGNFLAHAVVAQEGELPFAPALMVQSAALLSNMSPAQWAVEETPPPLPPLELSQLQTPDELPIEQIQQFLKEDENEDRFQFLLSALVNFPESERPVVLGCNHQEALNWLQVISASLPLDVLRQITFSTFSSQPGSARLSAIPPKASRFDFADPMASRFQYYVLNTITNHRSEIIPSNYAGKALQLIRKEPALLPALMNSVYLPDADAWCRNSDILVQFFQVQETHTADAPTRAMLLQWLNENLDAEGVAKTLASCPALSIPATETAVSTPEETEDTISPTTGEEVKPHTEQPEHGKDLSPEASTGKDGEHPPEKTAKTSTWALLKKLFYSPPNDPS